MPNPIEVKIRPDDVYVMIEALEHYSRSWEATEIVNRHGYMPDIHSTHVDCFDANTARKQFLKVRNVLRRFHRELDQVNGKG